MSVGVLVVGHGGIPTDFPAARRARFRELKRELSKGIGSVQSEFDAIELEIRSWPRSATTDPFWAGFEAIVTAMRGAMPEARVRAGYNEFCFPAIQQAIDLLVIEDACDSIVVISSMVTPGGSHSEQDIPEQIELARSRHPTVEMRYAWPFDVKRIAELFVDQVRPAR